MFSISKYFSKNADSNLLKFSLLTKFLTDLGKSSMGVARKKTCWDLTNTAKKE
jgi:hypothetical protein